MVIQFACKSDRIRYGIVRVDGQLTTLVNPGSAGLQSEVHGDDEVVRGRQHQEVALLEGRGGGGGGRGGDDASRFFCGKSKLSVKMGFHDQGRDSPNLDLIRISLRVSTSGLFSLNLSGYS
jgi:hypothetical protein